MEEIEFPDGTVTSVEEAKELLKDQYQTFLDDGTITLVTNTTETKPPLTNIEMATTYVTPDGTELSGQDASDLYKGQFNEFVENGTLKKKESSQPIEDSTQPSQEADSVLATTPQEDTTSSDSSTLPESDQGTNTLLSSQTIPIENQSFSIDGREVGKEEYLEFEKTQVKAEEEGFLSSDAAGDFEKSLASAVTPEMMDDYTEEYVVSEMNYKFGQYGFTFEEANPFGDDMYVKSANGEKKYIKLQRLWNQKETAEELEKFLRDNKDESTAIYLSQQVDKDAAQYRVIQNKEQLETQVAAFNTETQQLEAQIRDYAKMKSQLDLVYEQQFTNISNQELEANPVLKANYEAWEKGVEFADQVKTELANRTTEVKSKGSTIDILAGKYTDMQEKQGNWSGGIWNRIVKFPATVENLLWEGFYNTASYFSPTAGLREEQYNSELVRVAEEMGLVQPGTLEGATKEEIIEILGGDTNDWQFINEFVQNNAGAMSGVPGMAGPMRVFVPRSDFDKVHSKILDLSRKGVFEFETYEDAAKGRYRNPLSQTAFAADLSEGLKEEVRESWGFLKDDNVTEAWDKAKSEGFWGGAILGLAESLPAMAAGGFGYAGAAGWAATTAGMYAVTSDHVDREMSENAFFDNISESEKATVKIPIGIAVGALETLGMRNIVNKTGLVNGLVRRVFVRNAVTKATTAQTFRGFVNQEIKSVGGRIGLGLAAAGSAEFETGFAQEIAEVKIKDIYNSVKETDAFSTPDTWGGLFTQALRAGAQEAIGGFIIGTPSAVSQGVTSQNIASIDDTVFETFEAMIQDPTYKDMYLAKLKRQLESSNDRDAAGVQEEIDVVNQLQGIIESGQVGSDFGVQQRKEIVQLLFQKNALQNEIEVGDKELSTRKQNLLNKVNSRLAAISNQTISQMEQGTDATAQVQDFTESETETDTGVDDDVEVQDQEDIEVFFDGKVSDNKSQKSNNLSINRNNSPELNSTQNKIKNGLVRVAELGAKAIAKVAPNVRIVLHESNEQYLKYARNGEGRGEYNPNSKVIHINLTEATKSTVPHEIFHAVLMEKIGSEPAIARAAESMMASVRKTLKDDSELAVRIDKFAAQYVEQDENGNPILDKNGKTIPLSLQNEEKLAELVGILSSEYGRKLSKPTKNAIVLWVKDLARKFGIKIGSDFGRNDSDVIDLLNTIAGKTRTGEEITESDVKILTPGTPIPGADGVIPDGIQDDGPKIDLSSRSQLLDRRGIDMSKIKRGSINDLSGINAFVFAADQAVYGKTVSSTGLEFDFNGGFIYPYGAQQQGSNAVWVFSTENAANKVRNKVNNSDGVGLIMSQANDGITGNEEFYAYINAEVDNAIKKGASPQEMISYINEKLKLTKVAQGLAKKGLPAQISSLEELQTLLVPLNFEQRGSFTKTFLSKDSFERFGIPPFNPLKTVEQNISDNVTDPALSKVEYGDIVSAIQFEKDGKPFKIEPGQPGYHPAYSWALPGAPIMVFDNAVDIRKVYPNATPVTGNQTPLGKRAKPLAARSAMGGQYIAKVPSDIKVEGEQVAVKSQKTIGDLAKYYNMNTSGFFPNNAPIWQMRKQVEALGYKLKESKRDQYGRGGSYYLVNARGKKVNPMSSYNSRQQKKIIIEYINEARGNFFKEAVIRDYLVRTKGYGAKEVDALMAIEVDMLTKMPKSFGNIQGGAQAGVKLFKRVQDFLTKETKLNNKRKEKNQISEQAIMDKAIEFLENQEEYINESEFFTEGSKKKGTQVEKRRVGRSTLQNKMLIDLQSEVSIRPTQDMAAKIRQAKAIVSQRKKGESNLKKVQAELRNFLRRSLPKKIYTKPAVMKLITEINAATEETADGILKTLEDFVVNENIKTLEAKLNFILTGKYTKNQGQRKAATKVDNETRKRIEAIAKSLVVTKATTAEKIDEINAKLRERFNTLLAEEAKNNKTLEEMVDLQIVMQYNATFQKENLEKVQQLDSLVATLEEIVKNGRSVLKQELADASIEYDRQFAEAYYAITGTEVDMTDRAAAIKLLEEMQLEKNNDNERSKLNNRLVTWSKSFLLTMNNFINSNESMDGLMSKIDMLPGELFGGIMQENYTDRVDAANREVKARKIILQQFLMDNLQIIYGKNWKKVARQNRVKDLDAFGEIYQNDLMKSKGKGLILSQNEAAYLYNQYKDPNNRGSFEKKFGSQYARVMKEITENLTEESKEFADWQVEVYYPSLYEHYNAAYKKIYRTDLPWNQFYAGTLYREGFDVEPIDLLGQGSVYQTVVGSASTKFRTQNNLPIQSKDMMDVLATYTNEMEHFAAYSEVVRDMNKVFTNKYIKNSIEEIHGKKVMKLITDMVQKIASKGVKDQNVGDVIVDKMNTVFILKTLAVSPLLTLKQLSSTFTYAADIGYLNWAKYAMKNKLEAKKVWQEVIDNSVYMKDRAGQDVMRTIETYSEKTGQELIKGANKEAMEYWTRLLMANVRVGDRGAIFLGGMPNYSYYKAEFKKKNPNATEQEAIDHAIIKFERDTKRTQQSSDLQDKDSYQTGNPIYRALNQFLTTPKQYMRKEIRAMREIRRKIGARNLKAGKGTLNENLRQLMMFHVYMPVFFQYLSMGLPGLMRPFRDEDDEDLLRAAVLGNINGLFLLGEVAVMIADEVQGKPWAGKSSKSVGVLEISKRLIGQKQKFDAAAESMQKAAEAFALVDRNESPEKYKKAVLKYTEATEKFEDASDNLAAEISSIASMGLIPATAVNKFAKNLDKMSGADAGEAFLRLMNYSEYQITGPKVKEEAAPKTPTQKYEEYLKEQAKEKRKQDKQSKGNYINGGFDGGYKGGYNSGGYGDGYN